MDKTKTNYRGLWVVTCDGNSIPFRYEAEAIAYVRKHGGAYELQWR